MKSDRIMAIILFVFGTAVFLYCKDWQMEAGLYPQIIALLIAGLSILLFCRPQNTEKRDFRKMWEEVKQNWQLPAIVGLTLALILSIEPLGFFVALPIYLVLVMLVMGVRKVKTIAVPTVLTTAFIYVVFVLLLQIRIPVAFFIS